MGIAVVDEKVADASAVEVVEVVVASADVVVKWASVEEVDGTGVVVEGDIVLDEVSSTEVVLEAGAGVEDVPDVVEVVELMAIVVDDVTPEVVVEGDVLTGALVVENALAVVDKAALAGGIPQ